MIILFVVSAAVVIAAFLLVAVDFYFYVFRGIKLNLVPVSFLMTELAMLVVVLACYFVK